MTDLKIAKEDVEQAAPLTSNLPSAIALKSTTTITNTETTPMPAPAPAITNTSTTDSTAAANNNPSTIYGGLTNSQDDVPTCRICHCADSPSSGGFVKLISPCQCSGSLKYVHHGCLQQWLDATNGQRCELCRYPFSMSVKYKPLYKWSSLNASPGERRKLICNSVFNLVSMVCIFWSIYVLIERAALDARNGQIDWMFYVKISVVTIGLIIGVIFLFVQLKLYFSIFMKWRQSNRIIIIRDASISALQAARLASANAAANAAAIRTPAVNTAAAIYSDTNRNITDNDTCNVMVCP